MATSNMQGTHSTLQPHHPHGIHRTARLTDFCSAAVVLLHPLDFSGPVFDRTLTFTSESDRIEIGRSSQRASKDLSPRPNNALFDSRVMSRVHAILRVSLNEKVG